MTMERSVVVSSVVGMSWGFGAWKRSGYLESGMK